MLGWDLVPHLIKDLKECKGRSMPSREAAGTSGMFRGPLASRRYPWQGIGAVNSVRNNRAGLLDCTYDPATPPPSGVPAGENPA